MDAMFDKRVAQHHKLDAKIEELQKELKEKLRPFLEVRAKIRAELLDMLNKSGQDSAKTEFGTVSRTVRTTASIEDLELFKEHVIGTEDWEAIDWKANSTAAIEYLGEHDGQLPPGVKLSQSVDISVRAPGAATTRKPRLLPTKSNPFPEEAQHGN
jgi:hypothetical protein